jgi:hypothetical protein
MMKNGRITWSMPPPRLFLLLHLDHLFDTMARLGDVAHALAAGQVDEAAGVAS